MTRKQALDKAAAMLEKAENTTVNSEAVGKYLSCAQLYVAIAHELNSTPITPASVV